MVYENYKSNPKKFVDRLYNMGLSNQLGLSIKGEGEPIDTLPWRQKLEWNFIAMDGIWIWS